MKHVLCPGRSIGSLEIFVIMFLELLA